MNHLDGDASNNNVENLEWCTYSRNATHAHDIGLNNRKRPVLQINSEGKILQRFAGISDAQKYLGIKSTGGIFSALAGRSKRAHGYCWKYAEN